MSFLFHPKINNNKKQIIGGGKLVANARSQFKSLEERDVVGSSSGVLSPMSNYD